MMREKLTQNNNKIRFLESSLQHFIEIFGNRISPTLTRKGVYTSPFDNINICAKKEEGCSYFLVEGDVLKLNYDGNRFTISNLESDKTLYDVGATRATQLGHSAIAMSNEFISSYIVQPQQNPWGNKSKKALKRTKKKKNNGRQ